MGNNIPEFPPSMNESENYSLSGKIMLTAIVVLFAVVIFMILLQLYARWYLLRVRQRQLLRRRRRYNQHPHLVFYVDPNNPTNTARQGLDESILRSLPVFVYSSEKHPDGLECAVCLSEFEDNEKGRLLPKCNHNFHIECIDMWFHSHSTCPLCRSPVERVPNPVHDVVITVDEPVKTEPGSSSGLCQTCQHGEQELGSVGGGASSFGARRKGLDLVGVSIEVPRRNTSFGRSSEDELGTESPGFKSPGSRILSLKRILSRGLSLSGNSPSAASASNCGVVTESDIETQQTQGQTPRCA